MRNLPLLQEIPSVDSLLGTDPLPYPRTLVRRALNEVLDELRARILDGEVEAVPPAEELVRGATERIRRRLGPALRPVVNATGVVVHTNLGRSPLSRAAAEEVMAAATAYSNLEYDLETGERGDRYRGLLDTLRELTGAEDVLLVNNNAGAVLLCLSTLAAGREVAVSRGELVEIGGSFRIPDVMAASGATLTEVGTTNRTHRADYEEAIGDQTVALMKVHASNYRIVGFTSEVSVRELADIAAPRGLVVIYDMGSGILTDLRARGIPGDSTVRDAIEAGADVVTFSGDKLLGGPQVGIIAGRAQLIGQMKRNSLLRALRVGKLTLSALDATLRAYLMEREWEMIPTLRLLAADPDSLTRDAEDLAAGLSDRLPEDWQVTTLSGTSFAGGGSLPGVEFPTTLVEVSPPGEVDGIARLLRRNEPPVIARIRGGSLLFDPRTMLDGDADEVVEAFCRIVYGDDGGDPREDRFR